MTQPNNSLPFGKLELIVRSTLYFILATLSTLIIAPLMLCCFLAPFRIRYRLANWWVLFNLWQLNLTCQINHHIKGAENIPNDECGIIFCKHQSAWETIALQSIFPPQVFILKRELLRLPFFGWALATCDPIAIDRQSQSEALRQLIKQGKERLNSGRWVVVFPEGTRTAPGEKRKYSGGGAILAQKSGCRVVPVAHNAGKFWGRNSFLKYPGTIEVRIGPPIETEGRRASEINHEAADWIEQQMEQI